MKIEQYAFLPLVWLLSLPACQQGTLPPTRDELRPSESAIIAKQLRPVAQGASTDPSAVARPVVRAAAVVPFKGEQKAPAPAGTGVAPAKPAPASSKPDEAAARPSPAVARARARLQGMELWDDLLRRFCQGGRVDYGGIHREARSELDGYVKHLGSHKPPRDKKARLAFYLNAYNALVIKKVVDGWPGFKGVKTVPGFFKRLQHTVGGRKVTLDQLENKIIRPTFKDPRIHFALVCGARSCPPLRCRAFAGGSLDKVLEALTRRFINSSLGVREEGQKFHISRLFEWYKEDFVAASGSVGKYLSRYHKTHAEALAGQKTFSYQPYSWTLNKR